MSPTAFAAVGVGAALGAWLRWGLGVAFNAVLPELPLGTLAANLVGGYLIGVAVAIFEQVAGLAPEMRLFIITGFLGGLTTFSTFSAESMLLLTTGRFGWAVLHSVTHLAGSVALTAFGIMSVRSLYS